MTGDIIYPCLLPQQRVSSKIYPVVLFQMQGGSKFGEEQSAIPTRSDVALAYLLGKHCYLNAWSTKTTLYIYTNKQPTCNFDHMYTCTHAQTHIMGCVCDIHCRHDVYNYLN